MKTNIKSYLSSRSRELIIKTPFKISKKKKKLDVRRRRKNTPSTKTNTSYIKHYSSYILISPFSYILICKTSKLTLTMDDKIAV